MSGVDYGSIDLSDQAQVLHDEFSAIVHGSGFGELMSDLGISDHEHLSMFNPMFGDQSDDRSNFSGPGRQVGFEDSIGRLKREPEQALYEHALRPSSANASEERAEHYSMSCGDDQPFPWNNSKRQRSESAKGGRAPATGVRLAEGEEDGSRWARGSFLHSRHKCILTSMFRF